MSRNVFPWMDSIYLEERYGWFVSSRDNMLFCIDTEKRTYELITILPDSMLNIFRQNPRCLKYKNSFFCLPDCGDVIWVYILDDDKFVDIGFNNPDNKRISVTNFILRGSSLFLLSSGLREIFEVNVEKKCIVNEYDFSDECEEVFGSAISGSVIYILGRNLNRILEFDSITCAIKSYELPDIVDTLNTICFDGNNFWLSGFNKKIYIWNKLENKINSADEFSKEIEALEVYEQENEYTYEIDGYRIPVFRDSRIIGNKIIFIPSIADKIISCDINTKEVQYIAIENEAENLNDIRQRDLWTKFLVEYIRDNRYMGLYSFKNQCIVEFDAEKEILSYIVYKPEKLSENVLEKINSVGCMYLEEINEFHRYIFDELFRKNNREFWDIKKSNVGKSVYSVLK